MSEVEKLCDRVAIIHKGRLVEVGTLDEIKSRHGKMTLRIYLSNWWVTEVKAGRHVWIVFKKEVRIL